MEKRCFGLNAHSTPLTLLLVLLPRQTLEDFKLAIFSPPLPSNLHKHRHNNGLRFSSHSRTNLRLYRCILAVCFRWRLNNLCLAPCLFFSSSHDYQNWWIHNALSFEALWEQWCLNGGQRKINSILPEPSIPRDVLFSSCSVPPMGCAHASDTFESYKQVFIHMESTTLKQTREKKPEQSPIKN